MHVHAGRKDQVERESNPLVSHPRKDQSRKTGDEGLVRKERPPPSQDRVGYPFPLGRRNQGIFLDLNFGLIEVSLIDQCIGVGAPVLVTTPHIKWAPSSK